jgi:NDP-sugar pyrophosphorylase family protein
MKKIERVTITIKPEILKKLDKMIDGRKIRNRSHAVESLLLDSIRKTDINTALIMAGGDAANLRPISYEIPKALIPIHGKPILYHQIKFLSSFGIDNIFIAVGKHSEKIIEYFGDGGRFGVNIEYIHEERPLGTAGALSYLKGLVKNTFVMLNVDTLIDIDLPELFRFHKNAGSMGTVALATVDDPEKYGVARMRGNSVLEFVEKPRFPPSNLINAGLSLFEPEAIRLVSKRRFMIEELYEKLTRLHNLSGFVHDGQFFDVGNHAGYERAIKNWKSA